MSTIDMTQVAGLQAVNEEGQVIGTLSVDDLTELVATKIVQEAKNEAISARSASVMSEASTLAATDEYEDKLDIDTNPAYVRSLDSEGNPKRTATTSLATVVGGLIGIDNAIKIKGTLGVGTDLNSINTVGIFKMNGSYENCPCAASWGCLIIPPATASSLPQILIEVTSTSFNIFARRDANYNWHKINMTKI